MAATLYEYSLLCRMASYRQSYYLRELSKQPKDKVIHAWYEMFLRDSGWQSLPTSEELGVSAHGYFGVAYYKVDPLTNQAEVVIAHRGTCFNASTIGNILADIEIADRKPLKIIDEAAIQYLGKLHSSFRYNFETNKLYIPEFNVEIGRFTHTGFSLGGFIAGACTARSSSQNTYAVTFDAPGIDIEAMPFDRAQKAGKIRNIVTDPNLVNTCNPQVGEVEQLTAFAKPASEVKEEKIGFDVELADLGFGNSPRHPGHYADVQEHKEWTERCNRKDARALSTVIATDQLIKTIESHNLDKIIRVLSGSSIELQLRKVHRWPSAINILKRGPRQLPEFERFFGDTNFWAFALDGIFLLGQIVKGSGVAVAWELTKSIDERGQEVGLVGIQHERTNKVVYKDDYILEQFARLVLEGFRTALDQIERHRARQAAALANSQREVRQSNPSGADQRAPASRTAADLLSRRNTVYNRSPRAQRPPDSGHEAHGAGERHYSQPQFRNG